MFGILIDKYMWEETFDTIEEAQSYAKIEFTAEDIEERDFIGIVEIKPCLQMTIRPREIEWKKFN